MIAQDPTLFTGTLRFNLDPFNEYSAAAIEELLIKAGLQDLITREPEGSATDAGKDSEKGKKNQEKAQNEHTELTS